MSLRDDFQPKWKLLLKWGWLSFAVFILMAPTFYTVYISFNELGFGAKYYTFTFQWYENVFSDKQLIGALGWTMLLAIITLPIVIPFGLLSAKLYKQSSQKKRTGISGTFAACLELTREGIINMMQKKTFDEILIKKNK